MARSFDHLKAFHFKPKIKDVENEADAKNEKDIDPGDMPMNSKRVSPELFGAMKRRMMGGKKD